MSRDGPLMSRDGPLSRDGFVTGRDNGDTAPGG